MSNKFSLSTAGLFQSFYSPANLIGKISKVGKAAGVKVVYAALLLYYALLDKEVPIKDKMIVIGALGYFILPLDAIPDFLGPIGYTDDLSAMVLAAKTIWNNISLKTHEKARKQLSEWFDDIKPSDLKLF